MLFRSVPGVMNAFDFANPDLHVPKRLETTVPQQALFALNHPFVAERARSIVRKLWPEPGADAGAIERVWRAVLQRPPSSAEREGAIAFVASPDCDYMTGSTLTIDGGVSLPWWSNRDGGEM